MTWNEGEHLSAECVVPQGTRCSFKANCFEMEEYGVDIWGPRLNWSPYSVADADYLETGVSTRESFNDFLFVVVCHSLRHYVKEGLYPKTSNWIDAQPDDIVLGNCGRFSRHC